MEKENDKPKIVKNKSKANVQTKNGGSYSYQYTGLADLADQGVNIPKMRILPTEFGEYIEYFDGGEWHMGAKIVVPEGGRMNEAQAYGSALTYARRYTTMLAERVACDDDKNLEGDSSGTSRKAKNPSTHDFRRMDFNKIREQAGQINDIAELTKLYKSFTGLTPGQQGIFKQIFGMRKKEIEAKLNGDGVVVDDGKYDI